LPGFLDGARGTGPRAFFEGDIFESEAGRIDAHRGTACACLENEFNKTLEEAKNAGFSILDRPKIFLSYTALLKK